MVVALSRVGRARLAIIALHLLAYLSLRDVVEREGVREGGFGIV